MTPDGSAILHAYINPHLSSIPCSTMPPSLSANNVVDEYHSTDIRQHPAAAPKTMPQEFCFRPSHLPGGKTTWTWRSPTSIDGSVAAAGPLVVGLSTTITYTQLRADVYSRVIAAFDRALGQTAKVAAVAPFELCYDSSKLGSSLSGYSVPQVDVLLEGGTNLTVVGGNSMAQVNTNTACFAFLKAASSTAGPPVLVGGFQLENRLVAIDNAKQQLSFTGYLPARGFSCSNFNFTKAG
ncbi:hypothetical protein QYE76_049071 [Lolium multiflorum]|uniref:Xylanase inhibitor C-terminal domain-containing protein n=1 Tax=Lolium multiflorum TaxID=4521 RepID=A0AAD8SM97_LOLMU|nr:hypothetical protein QYE76_049071 [Lolium multiflorum]